MARFTSGPKPFPLCIEEVDSSQVGKLTYYPIGVDWATLFKWYFRVKKWKAEFTYSFTGSVSVGDASASAAAPSPIEADSTTNIEDETQFSCKTPIITNQLPLIYEYDYDSTEEAFAEAVVASQGANPYTLFISNTKIRKVGSLYYPFFRVGFNTWVRLYGGSSDGAVIIEKMILAGPNSLPGDPLATQIDVPVEIDGETGLFQWTYYQDVFIDGSASASADLNITNLKLTPEEYWSYDGIYDTDDGSELIDPFSV